MRQPAKTLDQVEKEIEGKSVDKRTLPREFEVEREPSGLYHVIYTSGGEIPDLLKGHWTSMYKAKTAISNYKEERQQKK
jgi:hypothetical protein